MLSTRGAAQLGLGAAFGLFALSLTALLMGAADNKRSPAPFVHAARPAAAIDVGEVAPPFTLADTTGNTFSLQSFRGQAVVLCFTTKDCPVSTDYAARLRDLSRGYEADVRVRFLAIHSKSPDAARSDIRRECAVAGLRFPQLVEAGAEVARRYRVESTPAFVVIDAAGVVRYAGAFDDSRQADKVRARHLPDALERVLGKHPVTIAKLGR